MTPDQLNYIHQRIRKAAKANDFPPFRKKETLAFAMMVFHGPPPTDMPAQEVADEIVGKFVEVLTEMRQPREIDRDLLMKFLDMEEEDDD